MNGLKQSRMIQGLCGSLLWISAICGCACSGSDNEPAPIEPPVETPAKPLKFSVATWNVHNFFDTVCDSQKCGGANYEPSVTAATYQKKLSNVKKGIFNIDADIVLLQEIEKESCLIDVRQSLGETIYQDYAFGEIGGAATVDVAILTRGKITNMKRHRGEHQFQLSNGEYKFLARELIEAEISLRNGIEVTAFVTHLVSKATDPEGSRRIIEAQIVQEIIADYVKQHPGRLVIFGGDLNDTPDSEPIMALNKDGVIQRSSKDQKLEDSYTWRNQQLFDYIFYTSEHEQNMKRSEVICDGDSGVYSDSDHCSVRVEFEFEPASN